MPVVTHFQKLHENYSGGKKLKLRINDNRHTMLSVRWNPDHTLVSLHRMFLEAPDNVMEALACYISKPKSTLSPLVKAFIDHGAQHLDYSSHLDASQLQTTGEVHDLRKIYSEINRAYFDSALDLKITWFGAHGSRNQTKVGLGYYQAPLKLIKINRVLDRVSVPEYVVGSVVFHEILHHVHPPLLQQGRNRIHHSAFRKHEQRYQDHQRAQDWLQAHRALFFIDA